MRGRAAAATIAAALVLACTGCRPPRLGPEARSARVLQAASGDYSKRLHDLNPGPADSLTRVARPTFRITRRWIAPPLLRSEFFVVEFAAPRGRDWYLMALDARAMPLVLRSPLRPPLTRGAMVPLDDELLNRMILEERITVVDPANAYWVARLAALLPLADATPFVVGEPQTAPDADPVSEALVRAATRDSLRPRVARGGDGYEVDLPVAYGAGPTVDVCRIGVRRDGTIRRLAGHAIAHPSAEAWAIGTGRR